MERIIEVTEADRADADAEVVGYEMYHAGIKRQHLNCEAAQRGWDSAQGEEAYWLSMMEQARYIDELQSERSE